MNWTASIAVQRLRLRLRLIGGGAAGTGATCSAFSSLFDIFSGTPKGV